MALIHDRNARGRTETGWLSSRHSFSFGGFSDPTRMGFRALRVLNEDRVAPGGGFAPHDHAEMDILTVVRSGALRHEDTLGHVVEIGPGEVQAMLAGTGIRHAEWNASTAEPVHFLQIWLIPQETGLPPAYAQAPLPQAALTHETGGWVPMAGQGGPIALRSDTRVLVAQLREDEVAEHELGPGRGGFLHVIEGMVEIEGERLKSGDALQYQGPRRCRVRAESAADLLLFDLG